MVELQQVFLPPLNPQELKILLMGLDELPGKLSRALYDKIVGHVNEQLKPKEPM